MVAVASVSSTETPEKIFSSEAICAMTNSPDPAIQDFSTTWRILVNCVGDGNVVRVFVVPYWHRWRYRGTRHSTVRREHRLWSNCAAAVVSEAHHLSESHAKLPCEN